MALITSMLALQTVAYSYKSSDNDARRLNEACVDSDMRPMVEAGAFAHFGTSAGDETCENLMPLFASFGSTDVATICELETTYVKTFLGDNLYVDFNSSYYPEKSKMLEICAYTCDQEGAFTPCADGYTPPDDRPPSEVPGFSLVVGDNVSKTCLMKEWLDIDGSDSCGSATKNESPDGCCGPEDDDGPVTTLGAPGCCYAISRLWLTEGLCGEGTVCEGLCGGNAACGRATAKPNYTIPEPGTYEDYLAGGDWYYASVAAPNSGPLYSEVTSHYECAEACKNTPGCTGIEVDTRVSSLCIMFFGGACNDASDEWWTEAYPYCRVYAYDSGAVLSQGDPITTFQGHKTRYWLSMEHFTPVFSQGPFVLSQLAGPANPPPGLEAHKGDWVVAMEVDIAGLDKIRIETVDPKALLASPNATASAAADDRRLTTVRLSAGGKNLAAGEHELSTLGAAVTASRVTGPEMQELKMGTGFVERIDIKAAGLHLRITSAKANKFADEALQVLGLHLDLEILTFDQGAARGALPEMWGLQPMSEATKLLLDKPAA